MKVSRKVSSRCRPFKCKKCKKRGDAQDSCVEASDGAQFKWCKHCGHIEYLSKKAGIAA